MDNMIRVELHFVNFDTPFSNGVWVFVNRSLLNTVNDFKCFLSKKFKFLDHRNMNLYVKTCLLPDDETILILRDEDVVRVVCEEQISFYDCYHNGSGEKVNCEVENHGNSLNLKRKSDDEFHSVAKKQKLPSTSICHSVGSAHSDSETPCNSNNSVSSLSINKQQEPISDFQTYAMQSSKKHKGKRKKSKHSKRNCDVPKHTGIQHTVGTVGDVYYDIREDIVDSVCEVISSVPENIETQGFSEHKSRKIRKKKKKESLSQPCEEGKVIAMNEEICVNYSLKSLGSRETKTKQIDDDLPMKVNSQTSSKDDNKKNAIEEPPAKLSSPTLSNRNENANETEKDIITELNNQSPPKANLSLSSGNNCHKKKRKRRRRRKTNSTLTDNDSSLNANMCITSSTPKLTADSQSFSPVLNYIGFSSKANIPVPKHTFFKEVSDNCSSSPQCEQHNDVPKPVNSIEEPCEILNNTVLDSSTQKHVDLLCEVLESSIGVQPQAFVNNVTIPNTTSIAVQEQLDKKLENDTHTEVCSPQDNLKKSYSDYPPLKSFPSVGSIIAYKILELSSSYCPEVSDYKEGKIVNTSNDTDDLEIELANEEVMAREGKFENIYPDQISEPQVLKKVTVNWTALIEPRLIHRCD